jgi:hypothetical protein
MSPSRVCDRMPAAIETARGAPVQGVLFIGATGRQGERRAAVLIKPAA